VTSDFKLVYKVLNLQIEEVEIVHLLDTNELTDDAIIITDKRPNTPRRYRSLRLHRNMTRYQLKKHILQFVQQDTPAWDVIFGIDPGVNIGLAVLYDETVLDTTIVLSLDSTMKWIRSHLQSLKPQKCLIRVGDGVKQQLLIILDRLDKEFSERIVIEIIDETNSSIKSTNKTTIHEQSAIIIAKRSGIVYHRDSYGLTGNGE